MCSLAKLWVAFTLGALMAVAYLVAPVAFSMLDKVTAGNLMGVLLHWVELFGVVVTLAAFMLCKEKGRAWMVAAFAALLLQLIWLNPEMAALKSQGLEGQTAERFMQLHGVSQALYLAVCGMLMGWLFQQVRAHKHCL